MVFEHLDIVSLRRVMLLRRELSFDAIEVLYDRAGRVEVMDKVLERTTDAVRTSRPVS
jgi:hypothetical protein